MTWTDPKTDWSNGDLVTADDMNEIGENLAVVRNLPTVAHTTTADISANAGEFVDVDSANLNLTLNTNGGDVLVHFHGTVELHNGERATFDIDVDGSRQGGDIGILHSGIHQAGIHKAFSFTRLVQGLSAGSHSVKLQWKSRGNIKLFHGAQFWAREI